MNKESKKDLKVFIMFCTGLFSILGLFYYFFVLPNEVFEITIDSSVEKLDTVYYPKLGSGGHYNNICKTYYYEMDDTIIYNGIKSFNNHKKKRICGDGYEVVSDTVIQINYVQYNAKNVKIYLKYEFYEY